MSILTGTSKDNFHTNGSTDVVLQKIFNTKKSFKDGIKVLVTPKEAQELLKFNTKNRSLNKRQVNHYAKIMLAGDWLFSPASWIGLTTGFLLPDKQHTLHAIIKSGVSLYFYVYSDLNPDIIFVLDEGKKRTAGDVGKILGFKYYTLLTSISRSVMAYESGSTGMAAAQEIHKTSAKQLITNKTIVERVESDEGIWESAEIANKLKPGKSDVKILTPSTIGLFYYIFSQKSQSDAALFLEKLVLGANLNEGSPIKKLRDYLISTKINGTRIGGVALNYYMRRAWYKFRKKESVSVFKKYIKNTSKVPPLI